MALEVVEREVLPASRPVAAAWLRRCVAVDEPAEAQGADQLDVDSLLHATWRDLPDTERIALGQVFTPREAAAQLLHEVDFPGQHAGSGHLVDLACGGGIFLMQSARQRAQALLDLGKRPREVAEAVLDHTHGIDVDPLAADLARLFLGLEVARVLSRCQASAFEDLPLPSVHTADATDPEALVSLRQRAGTAGLRWVVGNPPYLEAKRMPKPLRQRLKSRFGDRLTGAWDYYVAFLHLALEVAAPDGFVGLVLPNKFQVARYGESLRAQLLQQSRLRAIVDLSEVSLFQSVGVYPILLVLRRGQRAYRSVWKASGEGLGQGRLPAASIPYELLESLSERPVYLTLPEGPLPATLTALLQGHSRLEDQVEIRSTCSFHKKGLRERYVKPTDELPDGIPYLGGRSYSRKNEVRPYGFDWEGFRIHYAQEELREVGNPLPPLVDVFLRPKVIYCQHSVGMVAACDPAGRFVTKDVFPVALPRDGRADTAHALTALFNSRLFSAVYSLLYRGIQVGGGYLHFLPVYLKRMPLPVLGHDAREALVEAGAAVGRGETGAQEVLDALVFALYGVEGEGRKALWEYGDDFLGFDGEPLSRR